MRVYVDSSALLKRVIDEPESDQLVSELDKHARQHALLLSSSLAWIEVARAIRSRYGANFADIADDVEAALAGIAELSLADEVVSLARRLNPNALRTLDAMHLASALLLDVDVLLTYDERLAAASRDNGLVAAAPGQ